MSKGKSDQKSSKFAPPSAGQKGNKRGGFYYQIQFKIAAERKKRREEKRQMRFALRRIARKEGRTGK